MLRIFFGSKKWFRYAYGYGALLLLSLYLQVCVAVYLNGWYEKFYSLFQNPVPGAIHRFWELLGMFFLVVLPLVGFLHTATSYLARRYVFWWRWAMTENYILRWRNTTQEIEGASQRIQEDTGSFANILESLGMDFIRSIMTLIAFLPILWGLSKNIRFDLVGLDFLNKQEGALVYIALVTSVFGLVISCIVGRKLVGLEYGNQRVEARLRKELVYGEDDRVNFAHPRKLAEMFTGIRTNHYRLYLHYGYFDMWASLYEQVIVLLPLLIVAPNCFLATGALAFGGVMQINNAFGQVYSSLSIFNKNFKRITELRSIWKRLHEFEKILPPLDPQKTTEGFNVGSEAEFRSDRKKVKAMLQKIE